MVNSKTTAVRLIPAIGKTVGEELSFGGLLGGALLLFIPGHIWDFAGIGLFIIVYCLQRYYCPAGFRQTA